MKTGFITTMLLLFAAGMAQAQDNQTKIDGNPNVNTIVVNTTGDVTICQGDKFAVKWSDETIHYNMNFELKDSVAYLSGSDDFEVTMPMLKYLEVNSAGDVVARDEIVAKNISICSNGTGDVDLNLICSNIYLRNNGSGDVTLRGNANALMVETKGKGTNNAVKLKHSVSIINGYGQKNDELAVLRVGGEGTVNQYNPNSEGWLYETRQFAEFMDATLSWTCQRCAAFTFERVGNEWALKGVENIPQKPENARLVRSAAPFFNQEQNRNRGIAESEDLTNVTENDTLKNTREQLDEDLGNLVKDITQGIVKGSRENWDEDQWNAWGDSLEMRAKEYERNAKKYEKEMERQAKEIEKNANVSVQYDGCETGKRSLLFHSYWESFEMGPNMLFDPQTMNTFSGPDDLYAIKPINSWYIGENAADLGIAFDRNHNVGIFTGVGFGVNIFRWREAVRTENVDGHAQNVILDLSTPVKKSRLSVLYAQVPLMIEISPNRSSFYLDLGVTGGVRLVALTKVKWQDGHKERFYDDFGINLFKLDASLRVGSDDIGFFANYSLIPMLNEGDLAGIHPLSIGFSINF